MADARRAEEGMPRGIAGLSEVVGLYDGFIFDLWGVVHDGVRIFPAVLPALQELRRAKRKVWMLSNAPRRAALVGEHLAELGVPPALYDGIVTSGEAAHSAMRDQYLEKWGRRCLHLDSRGINDSLVDGLDVQLVEKVSDADFLLNSFFNEEPERYAPLLEECLERNIPMICPNPDRVVHVGEKMLLCPGTLADIYEKMGGSVSWFGKPYRDVYSRCLGGMNVPRILAVGDGMPTDIAGAAGAGIDSALVVSGIHRGQVKDSSFFSAYPWRPTYLMNVLSW